MNHTNILHLSTIEDGGLSETMRRIETMIRRHAPMLMRLPDLNKRGANRLMSQADKIEIIRLLNTGMNAYQVAKKLGLSDRAVRYYRRYATNPVRGSTGAAEAAS